MDTETALKLAAAVISGLASGFLVALANHFFTRRKTHAETRKLEAEAEKIRAETQKLLTEMTALTSSVREVSYKLGKPEETILYDGSDYSDGSHFKGFGDRFYGESSDKPRGVGSMKIENGVLNVQRKNTEGRYRITLLKYLYDGVEREYLPKNDLIAGKRQLKLTCEAKAIGGTHTVLFIMKKVRDGEHLDRHEEIISRNEWAKLEAYFRISPSEDCQLWIDQRVSSAVSSLQIRKLILSEIGS